MENNAKKISLLALFGISFSCYGAENPSVAQQQPTPKRKVHFYHDHSDYYKDLMNEKRTTTQRHATRLKAQAKKNKLARETHHQTARSLAAQQANSDYWETTGTYTPAPYTNVDDHLKLLREDEAERAAKLEAVTHIQEFEAREKQEEASLSELEQRERQKAAEDAQKVAFFLKIAAADPAKSNIIEETLCNSLHEFIAITTFILADLIKQGILTDKTLLQKAFNVQKHAVRVAGGYSSKAFQQSIRKYLETYDYSFSHLDPFYERAKPSIEKLQNSLRKQLPLHRHPVFPFLAPVTQPISDQIADEIIRDLAPVMP